MASRDPEADDRDFFPTPPWAARAGAEIIKRALDPDARSVWEPACGAGHMVHALADYFPVVHASDAYLYDGNVIHDFLGPARPPFGRPHWIFGNPPFAPAEAFIRRAWDLADHGVAMLMRSAVLEGQGRHALLYGDCPLTVVAPFSERVPMGMGRYDPDLSSAAFYSWFFFVKPVLRPERFMARIGGQSLPAVLPIAPGTRARLFHRSDLALSVGGHAASVLARLKAEGHAVAGPDFDLLAKVAKDGGSRGVTPNLMVYPAGRLATLRAMGLLTKSEPDRLGDCHHFPTPDGWAVLEAREGGR